MTPKLPLRDGATVTAAGDSTSALPAGVIRRDVITHVDERGYVVEVFDPRWEWHPEPMTYCYNFTVRPGFIKGWGLHKEHDDRYFLVQGEMEVILYDERPDSPTCGLVSTLVLSEYRRGLLCIPMGVWHANKNIGSKDAVVLNFPTKFYDHANPDKYRLPLNNDRIPYKFDNPRGF